LQRLFHGGGAFRIDALDVNMDETLALLPGLGRRLAFPGDEFARVVPLEGEHRMRHEAHGRSLRRDFAQDRIEQKRHVVVANLDDGDGFERLRAGNRPRIRHAHAGDARGALLQMIEARPRKHRDFLCRIGDKILGRGASEQRGDEAARQITAILDKQRRLSHQLAGGIFLVARVKTVGVHRGFLPAHREKVVNATSRECRPAPAPCRDRGSGFVAPL